MSTTTETPRDARTAASTTSICRTISVEIENRDRRGSRRGGHVKVERMSGALCPTSDFLKAILPGKKIECVCRPTMSNVWEYGGPDRPSSLFYQAVHQCFNQHFALTLRPEVLMHLIVNEVATTVKQHADDYRHLFTTAAAGEKTRIDVRHDGLVLGDPGSPWHECIEMFGPKLAEAVPPGIMEHLLPGLSTHSVESRTAGLVAFMAAASPFFDYHSHTMCGIPEVRLAGTPDDYRKMLAAASQLSEVFRGHLGTYFDHLLPVLRTLALQADGAPVDQAFWSSLYKFESASGTDNCNGWITTFVNYVQKPEVAKTQYREAEVGGIVPKPADAYDWRNVDGGWGINGLALGSVPSQVCTAPLTWHYFGKEIKMLLAGGPLGIEDHDGSVMPVLSYAVLHEE